MSARLQYSILGLLLVVFFAIAWVGREPAMRAAGEDEFVYLALSKSVAAGSYREIFRPTAPLHVQYPPGYPTLMALTHAVAGDRIDAHRLVSLAAAAGALVMMFFVMRRLAGPVLALALVLLLVINRDVLRMSGALVSENLFLLLATAALAWTLTADPREERSATPAIVLALLAFLTRSIGLAVVLGVGYWLWSRREWRMLAVWAVALLLVVGGWFTYTILGADSSVRSYTSDFVAVSANTGGTLKHLASRVWGHGVEYAISGMPYALSLPTIKGSRVDNWVWLVANVILLGTGAWVLWRRWPAAAIFLPVYIGLVLVWPYMDGRLIVPLIPLGIMTLLLGAERLARFLSPAGRPVALGALVGLFALGAGQGAYERLRTYRHCDRAHPYISHGCYPAETLALVKTASFLRDHAQRSDIVLSQFPATVNYLSGLQVEALVPGNIPPDHAGDRLRDQHIRYVVAVVSWTAKALLPSCGELRVAENNLPYALLLSTRESDGGENACATLDRLAREGRL